MRTATLLLGLTFVLAGIGGPAMAQPTDIEWDGDTDTNWANPANWVGDAVPTGNTTMENGDAAVFPAALTLNLPQLTADQQVNGLKFQKTDGGWTISNDGTLHELFIVPNGAVVEDLATSGTTTIDANLRQRSATWNLSGGDMNVTGKIAFEQSISGLTVNGGTASFDSLDKASSGGRIDLSGSGTLELRGAAGANVAAVTNNGGTIRLGHKDALGSGIITSNGGMFEASTDLTGANAVPTELQLKNSAGSGHAIFSGSHSIELSNLTRFGGGGKTLTNNIDAGKTLEITNDVTALYSGYTILGTVSGTGETVLGADLSGPGAVYQYGPGVLTLSGSNSHGTGQQTRLNDGVLKLAGTGAGGAPDAGGLAQIKTSANPDGSAGGVIGLASGDFTRELSNTEKVDSTVKMYEGGGFAAYGADRNVNFFGDGRLIGWNSGGFVRPTEAGGVFILGHETADATVTLVNPLNIQSGAAGAPARRIQVNDGSADIDGRIGTIQINKPDASVRDFSIEKTGEGTLEITDEMYYDGTTTVSAGRLLINADASLAIGDWTIASGATLGGTGTIGGATTVNGSLAPGASAGELTFSTDVTLDAAASLDIEIGGTTAGTEHDVLDVVGTLDLGSATLNVTLIDAYSPAGGETFDILDWGTLSNTFGTVNLPTLDSGLSWDDSALYTDGTLSVSSAVMLGDVNGDGVVDGLDIQPFVDLLTGGGYQAEADINSDAVVDGLDIQPFVDIITGAGGNPVPEPAGLALLGLGALALVRRRKH